VQVHQNKEQYLNETGFGEEFKNQFQMETQLSNLDLRLRYLQTQLNDQGKKLQDSEKDTGLEFRIIDVSM